jgi:acetolactate synthase regulatory subunit
MALTLKHITSGPVIVTRYLGPTDHRGSRIKATHKRDSETTEQITISWDYKLNSQANHQAAAEQLLSQWGYSNDLKIVSYGWDHDSYYWLTSCPRLA